MDNAELETTLRELHERQERIVAALQSLAKAVNGLVAVGDPANAMASGTPFDWMSISHDLRQAAAELIALGPHGSQPGH